MSMDHSLPEVPAVLPRLRNWIDGQWQDVSQAEGKFLHDPGTGGVLQTAVESTPAQWEQALSATVDQTHHPASPQERASALRQVAGMLETRQEEIAVADSLNSGVPLSVTRLVAASLSGTFIEAAEFAAEPAWEEHQSERGVRIGRVPWGPALLIAPWNAPSALVAKKAANALAAGCPAIIKPSQQAPSGAQYIAEALASTSLAGQFSLIHGSGSMAGRYVADPRVACISMTGSTSVGRTIAAAAGANFTRLRLELGSANPAVILADADLLQTADALFKGMTKLNGQWCEAPRVVFAPSDLIDGLVEELRRCASASVVGSPLDPDVTFGPLSSEEHRDTLAAEVSGLESSGYRRVPLRDVPEEGFFLAPQVLVGPALEDYPELFGPVLLLVPHDQSDPDSNPWCYSNQGLAGYVFASDTAAGLALAARLPAGEVKVNGTSLLDMCAASTQSFWGESGIGEHGARQTFEFFRGSRVVGIDAPAPL